MFFSRPVRLRLENNQLRYSFQDTGEEGCAPIEDLGYVVCDNDNITITTPLLNGLLQNNVVLVTCDATHHPSGITLPLDGHQVQQERYRDQIEAGVSIKKQLWKQTIKMKLNNQACHLGLRGINQDPLIRWMGEVRSGDPDNYEARGSAYYWPKVFSTSVSNFRRERIGLPPNNLLNYGYAVLRAATARAIVGSGLLPSLGIHHHNRDNAFALADDLMEPYRPFVDFIVYDMLANEPDIVSITKEMKAKLISLLSFPVMIQGEKTMLMIGLSRTTYSLVECFQGKNKKLCYPEFIET